MPEEPSPKSSDEVRGSPEGTDTGGEGHSNGAPVSQSVPQELLEHSEEDDSDDYLQSDGDDIGEFSNSERLAYGASILDHSQYFADSLSQALDSLSLDKSLVVQAQLSGQLNNENQKIQEKRLEVLEKVKVLEQLYEKNFGIQVDPVTNVKSSRVKQLQQDLQNIEKRLTLLKEGHPQKSTLKSIFAGSKKDAGVIKRFPVEYNQARDKVLERQIDD